jgi:hypothetical protein
MTLGDVLRNGSLRPLPLRHVREISLQIIRGVQGKVAFSPFQTVY